MTKVRPLIKFPQEINLSSSSVFNNELLKLKERVKNTKPISVSSDLPIDGVASGGLMALNKMRGNDILGRGVPENTIFRARLDYTSDNYRLSDIKLLVSRELFPCTHDGKDVVGYEDPTFVSGDVNPFVLGEDGFICSQTHRKDNEEGLSCNLVYIGLDPFGKASHIKTLLTPNMLVKHDIALDVDMVKEAEIFQLSDGRFYMLFEYAGAHFAGEPRESHIGIARIEDKKIVELKRFWTADNDRSEHVSTDSELFQLADGLGLIFFNRGHNNVWGITYMVVDTNSMEPLAVCPGLIISAPGDVGRGPGDQLIAFVSQVTLGKNGSLDVFYHVNDNRLYCAEIDLASEGQKKHKAM